MPTSPLILVTNDDGIHAPGIQALAAAMAELGRVVVCAPDRERSAVSHGISLHKPLRIKTLKDAWYMVDGTPADCVLLGVRRLLGEQPALVVSGINNGPNLGDDVTYSGTMAGAREGMMVGCPAIAFSNASYTPEHFDTCGRAAARVAAHVLEHGLPENVALNVNIPDVPYEQLEGFSITRMGRRHYEDDIFVRQDPRGRDYYWIGGMATDIDTQPGTDIDAIQHNRVSVTPIHRDTTHHDAMVTLQEREIAL